MRSPRLELIALGCALFCAAPADAQELPCPPAGFSRDALLALKANNYEIANARLRRAFAQGITACLASPDPELRDGVAYEALATLLRARRLDVATQTAITVDLLQRLNSDDPQGYERPFAALALSEIVRAERLNSHFTDDMYENVLGAALAYFVSIDDYRGFDESEGWRHGAAHGADLLMQIALSDHYGESAATRIRDAIATQIAPPQHFYIYGEPARLARPILVLASKGRFTPEDWSVWFAAIADPAPLANWNEAFASQQGLARRHNLNAFLAEIYANASLAQDQNIRALLPGAEAALRQMP